MNFQTTIKNHIGSALSSKVVFVSLFFILFGSGCNYLQELANLRNVDFALDGVTDLRLAGVSLQKIKNPESISPLEFATLAQAVIRKDFPLDFMLHVGAENPQNNTVNARLTQFDWRLMLQDEPTINGAFLQEVVMPPGQRVDIPLGISLNLTDFFEGNARDLINIVSNLVGQGGEATNIKLMARPTILTPIGPIQYPNEIAIVSRTVGNP